MDLGPKQHKLKELGPYLLIGGPLFVIGAFLLQGASTDISVSAARWVVGLGLILTGGLILAYPISEHLFGDLVSGLFWPSEEVEPTPMYGIPETLARKADFEAALREYEKIIAQYPHEVRPYTAMLKITLHRLHDRPRAEAIYRRGLADLTKEEARAGLTRVYQALLSGPAPAATLSTSTTAPPQPDQVPKL